MKRFHVHVHVDDLAQSIRFYSTLFAGAPSVVKHVIPQHTDLIVRPLLARIRYHGVRSSGVDLVNKFRLIEAIRI